MRYTLDRRFSEEFSHVNSSKDIQPENPHGHFIVSTDGLSIFADKNIDIMFMDSGTRVELSFARTKEKFVSDSSFAGCHTHEIDTLNELSVDFERLAEQASETSATTVIRNIGVSDEVVEVGDWMQSFFSETLNVSKGKQLDKLECRVDEHKTDVAMSL